MTYLIVSQDELYHHGIKGQKWGVRRYQNPDGTLTEAGKKRYARLYTEDGQNRYNKNVTTQQLGYTPLKGRRGDLAQRRIASRQIKVMGDQSRNKVALEKAVRRGDVKLFERTVSNAERYVAELEYGKQLQKTYAEMSKNSQRYVRAGFAFTGKSDFLNSKTYSSLMADYTKSNFNKDNVAYSKKLLESSQVYKKYNAARYMNK